MFKFADAEISKVVGAGKEITCLLDRYVVCKVKKEVYAGNAVFEVGDTVICCTCDGRILVTYFDSFQKTETSDFLTKCTLNPYSRYIIECNSMEKFRELFEPLDKETEALEAFMSKVKNSRTELSEAKINVDKAEVHYDKVAKVRQGLTGLIMMLTAIAGACAVCKFVSEPLANIYVFAFIVMVCIIIGVVGFTGMYVLLLSDAEKPLNFFTIHNKPMVKSAEKEYNAEVENHCLKLDDLRAHILC